MSPESNEQTERQLQINRNKWNYTIRKCTELEMNVEVLTAHH